MTILEKETSENLQILNLHRFMLPLFYIAPQGPIVVSESDLFGVKLTIEINLL